MRGMHNGTEGGQSNDEPDGRSQRIRRLGEVGARHFVRLKSRICQPWSFLSLSSVKAGGSAVGCVWPLGGPFDGSSCSLDTTRLSNDIYRWSNEVKRGANLHFRNTIMMSPR